MRKILFLLFALLLPVQALAAETVAQATASLMALGMPSQLAAEVAGLATGSAILPNNTYSVARNAAGTANINVFKVDATDDTVLNADTGDLIKLSVAGTTEASLEDDQLTISGAAFQVVPGATSLTFRNNADSSDNLSITDAGVVTSRAGFVATAGGLTATAGDIINTAGNTTTTAGNVAITAGNLTFGAASAKVIPGATSLLFQNNANNATNVTITDAGRVTIRENLVFTTATSQILPGATSISLRNTANNADNLIIVDAGAATFRSTIVSAGTSTIGWSVVSGANTACTTTCTAACVLGVNTGAVTADFVDCADATADKCLCAGAS